MWQTLHVGDKFYPKRHLTGNIQWVLIVRSITDTGINYQYGPADPAVDIFSPYTYTVHPLEIKRLKSWSKEYACEYVPAFVLVDHELID